jgi:site-specific recombinase XerC
MQGDLFRFPRKPWNTGRIIGAKAPLKPKHVWAIRQQLKAARRVRDLRQRSTVIQQKTGRPVPFEITDPTRNALADWLAVRGRRFDDWLFPSRSRAGQHIGTRQYARLVDEWVTMIDLEPQAYGTHSLRRTKVALVYKKTGNLRACQLLLGHRKLESTVRYLGIEVEDALELSEQVDL